MHQQGDRPCRHLAEWTEIYVFFNGTTSEYPFYLDEHSSTSMLDHVTEQTNIDSMLRYRPSVSMVYYRPRVISRSCTNWRRSISSFKKSFWWFAALIFKLNSFIFELCLLLCWIIRPCHTTAVRPYYII